MLLLKKKNHTPQLASSNSIRNPIFREGTHQLHLLREENSDVYKYCFEGFQIGRPVANLLLPIRALVSKREQIIISPKEVKWYHNNISVDIHESGEPKVTVPDKKI